MTNTGNDQGNIGNAADAPPRAGKREWIGLAVLGLPTLLLALDLKPSSTQQLWILDIYGSKLEIITGWLVEHLPK